MIPVQQVSNFNIGDLPTRASLLEEKALSLSGGRGQTRCFNRRNCRGRVTAYVQHVHNCPGSGGSYCTPSPYGNGRCYNR